MLPHTTINTSYTPQIILPLHPWSYTPILASYTLQTYFLHAPPPVVLTYIPTIIILPLVKLPTPLNILPTHPLLYFLIHGLILLIHPGFAINTLLVVPPTHSHAYFLTLPFIFPVILPTHPWSYVLYPSGHNCYTPLHNVKGPTPMGIHFRERGKEAESWPYALDPAKSIFSKQTKRIQA